MIPFFLFVFGLIIGSFLNAVIYRLRLDESFIKGRSRCPHCRHTLSWTDLVPVVSWLWLRGRCRYCRKPISIQYPLVELGVGLAFVILGSVYPLTETPSLLAFISGLVVTSLLTIIFVYDWKHYIIPDVVVWPLAMISAMTNLLLGRSWLDLLLGGIVGAGFFWLQYILSRGRWIGFGDVKLGLAMGLLLGWPEITVALMIAYLIGSIIGILLIALGRKRMTSQVPFGTFLSLSTFVVLLYGERIWSWYQYLVILP